MIDKILDFKDNMPDSLYKEIYDESVKNNDARTLFMLAYFVKSADIKELSEEILKTNNLRYISFFMRSISGIDKNAFLGKVLELGTPRDAYYCMFDNRDLDDKQIFKLMDKCKEDQKYYFLSIYHYFITLKRFNEKLLREVKGQLDKINIEIDETNYIEVLKKIKEKEMADDDYVVPEDFSLNKYEGRKDYIPDMIVLHSTANFKKGIKNFYDVEKEVSAHFIINTDGEVKQIVSLDDSAWANGTSLNTTSDVYYRFADNELVRSRAYNANYYTFSIEHVSFDGELTEAQYESSKRVIKEIIAYIDRKYHYRFKVDKEHIVGHRDINPIVRTICPGKVFPIDKMIKDLQDEI